MSAGSALLALAGPVGWGIGAVGIAGGTLLARRKNGKIIDLAQTEEREVSLQTSKLRIVGRSAEELKVMTSEHYQGTEGIVDELEKNAPHDYTKFNAHQKAQLGALVNHINALSKLINKKIQ